MARPLRLFWSQLFEWLLTLLLCLSVLQLLRLLLVTLLCLSVIQLLLLLLGVQPLFSLLGRCYSTCVRTRCSLIDWCSSSSLPNELAGLLGCALLSAGKGCKWHVCLLQAECLLKAAARCCFDCLICRGGWPWMHSLCSWFAVSCRRRWWLCLRREQPLEILVGLQACLSLLEDTSHWLS